MNDGELKPMPEPTSLDIREILQKAEGPSHSLDESIAEALEQLGTITHVSSYSTDITGAITLIEAKGYDWIMANVNGQVGGTPFACVGVHESEASYSATPLLSLWLSYFRLELGDERKQTDA